MIFRYSAAVDTSIAKFNDALFSQADKLTSSNQTPHASIVHSTQPSLHSQATKYEKLYLYVAIELNVAIYWFI